MGFSTPFLLLVPVLLFFLLQIRPTFAIKKSYVVYMGEHSHGPDVSALDLQRVTESHYQLLGTCLKNKDNAKDSIFYSYTRNINGFAAILEEDEAAEIAKHPNVVSVFVNKVQQLHTTRSWDFLRLENNGAIPSYSIWNKARFGEDTIIGNLDTGVWPESKSFSDEGMGPIPSRWKGICQSNTKDGFRCNRKLIGGRYFYKGFEASYGRALNSTYKSVRDYEGHGSHTLSTAGGNFVPGASVFGLGKGTAQGGSPKARVAAYKVCYPSDSGGCADADILAGFEAAIHDGVDVLSVSLGGTDTDYFNSGIFIGSFHAFKKGINVVASAGNSGPDDGTVSNTAPWIFTVGASTMDREFPSYVSLGNKKHFKGSSLSDRGLPVHKFYPLISAADAKALNASVADAILCKPGTLDPKKVNGKILACLRGDNARVDKGIQAAIAGAVGMILCNNEASGNEILSDAHVLPASHVTYTDGLVVFAYINSTKSPIAYLSRVKTQVGIKSAPYMASFSSKGPNKVSPEILKPDITAPGVDVIAAYTEALSPTEDAYDKRRVAYNTMSGTSMSCPHVSGIVGLLKTLHPDWSPSAIKSAVMTSASTRDNSHVAIRNASFAPATPFSYGSGHVQPNSAMDPGLVYDLTVNDYLNFLCALGYNQTIVKSFSGKPYACPKPSISLTDFNYPSITVPKLSGLATVKRTVKNVGSAGTYHARVQAPPGVQVTVKPKKLKFNKTGQEKSFTVKLKVKKAGAARDYVFGQLTWSDGVHHVRSPIVVKAA